MSRNEVRVALPDRIQEFLLELSQYRTEAEVEVAREVIEWCRAHGLRVEFGDPLKSKGLPFWPRIPGLEGRGSSPIQLWTKSKEGVTILYDWLVRSKPFNIEAKRAELRRRIESIPGIDPKPQFPSITLGSLLAVDVRNPFFELVEWIVETLKRSSRDVRI